MLWPGATTGSKYRPVWKWERPPLFGACWHRRSEISWSKMLTISLRRKVKTGRLRSCRRAADLAGPLHPPHPPCPSSHSAAPAPASTRLAASSRGSGERFGGLGRAAKPMEASAGDDRDLRDHRPNAAAAPKCQVRWEGEARGSGQSAQRSASPPGFSGCGGLTVSGGGLDRPGSPPRSPPCLSVFPTAAGC